MFTKAISTAGKVHGPNVIIADPSVVTSIGGNGKYVGWTEDDGNVVHSATPAAHTDFIGSQQEEEVCASTPEKRAASPTINRRNISNR